MRFTTPRWLRTLAAWLLIALVFLVTHKVYWKTAWVQRSIPIMTWGYVHYDLNAKYFQELRYTDLYACMIEADRELLRKYPDDHVARDLDTYEPVYVREYKPCPRNRFTDERWREFVMDLQELSLATTMYEGVFAEDRELYWRNIIYDKGYNAPPPLIMISQWTITAAEWAGSAARPLSSMVDVVFMAMAFYAVYTTFGRRATFFMVLAFFAYWGTTGLTLGSLWQYGWYAATLLMLVCVKRQRFVQAGWWLAFAATTRVFPVFFVLPFAWRLLIAWKERRQQEARAMAKVLLAFGAGALALVGLSMVSGFGIEPWMLFAQKIKMHSAYIVGELFDIGLKNMIATFATNDLNDFARLEIFHAWKPIWLSLASLGTLLLGWWNRRASLEHLLLLVTPILFLWLVLSPYYYHVLFLPVMVVVGWDRKRSYREWRMADWWLVGMAMVGLALHFQFGWTGVEYTTYSLVEHRVSEVFVAVYLFGSVYLLGLASRQQYAGVERMTK